MCEEWCGEVEKWDHESEVQPLEIGVDAGEGEVS